jgi:hypothetical protein
VCGGCLRGRAEALQVARQLQCMQQHCERCKLARRMPVRRGAQVARAGRPSNRPSLGQLTCTARPSHLPRAMCACVCLRLGADTNANAACCVCVCVCVATRRRLEPGGRG